MLKPLFIFNALSFCHSVLEPRMRGNVSLLHFLQVIAVWLALAVTALAWGADEEGVPPAEEEVVDSLEEEYSPQDAADELDPQVNVSRRRASELASELHEGRILNMRLEDGHWRVRMDSEGTVFNVFVNAQTGEVSRQ